jgi:hypothetical protein
MTTTSACDLVERARRRDAQRVKAMDEERLRDVPICPQEQALIALFAIDRLHHDSIRTALADAVAAPESHLVESVPCKECGRMFLRTNPTMRICSDRCRGVRERRQHHRRIGKVHHAAKALFAGSCRGEACARRCLQGTPRRNEGCRRPGSVLCSH